MFALEVESTAGRDVVSACIDPLPSSISEAQIHLGASYDG